MGDLMRRGRSGAGGKKRAAAKKAADIAKKGAEAARDTTLAAGGVVGRLRGAAPDGAAIAQLSMELQQSLIDLGKRGGKAGAAGAVFAYHAAIDPATYADFGSKFNTAGLGGARGWRSAADAAAFFESSVPSGVRELGVNAVDKFLELKDASHIRSFSNAPELVRDPKNIVWEYFASNRSRGAEDMTALSQFNVALANRLQTFTIAAAEIAPRAAFSAAAIEAVISVIENSILVYRGQKDIQTAVDDTMRNVGKSAIVGLAIGMGIAGASAMGLAPVLSAASPALIVLGSVLLVYSFTKRIHGALTYEEESDGRITIEVSRLALLPDGKIAYGMRGQDEGAAPLGADADGKQLPEGRDESGVEKKRGGWRSKGSEAFLGVAEGVKRLSPNPVRLVRRNAVTREQLRFLVVMAHPHDFTHVAGTCGAHSALGDEITWVSMTSGRMTHNERLADELRKPHKKQDPSIVNQSEADYAGEKARELEEVAALFGVTDVRVLSFTDKPFVVERQPASVEAMRELVLQIRPHVIITQSPFADKRHGMAMMQNNDHTETGVAVMEAKLLAQLPRYGQRVAPHVTPAAFFPGIYFPVQYWDFAVDVTDQIDARKKAESLYKTQGHDEEYAARRVEVTVGHQGLRSGVPYAEGYVQENFQTVSSIELSEHTLAKGVELRADAMRAIAGKR